MLCTDLENLQRIDKTLLIRRSESKKYRLMLAVLMRVRTSKTLLKNVSVSPLSIILVLSTGRITVAIVFAGTPVVRRC